MANEENEILAHLQEIAESLKQAREALKVSGRRHQLQMEAQGQTSVALAHFAEASSVVETNNQLRHRKQVELLTESVDTITRCVNLRADEINDRINAQTGVIQSKMRFDNSDVELLNLKKKPNGTVLGGLIRIDGEEFHVNRKALETVRKIGVGVIATASGFVGHYWHIIAAAIHAAPKGH